MNISSNLKVVCSAIQNQCERPLAPSFELSNVLECLSAQEKFLVSKFFCDLPKNIGTFKVLCRLQQLKLLTATEYILSLKNPILAKIILCELLETDFELLANLFISAAYGDQTIAIKIIALLEDALTNLFVDLFGQPQIGMLSYVTPLCRLLPGEVLLTKVIFAHINILLEMSSTNVQQAFAHFSTWINEGVDELKFIKLLCEKLFFNYMEDTLSYLFKLSTLDSFKGWKLYLILIQSLSTCCTPESASFIKRYLKNRLLHIAGTSNKIAMLHLLLTARAAAATTMDIQHNLDAYADWYKHNIGELTYMLDVEKFKIILSLLQDAASYEMEEQYLEIHVAISISPPLLCGKLVQSYKNKCKSRLLYLKTEDKLKDLEAPK